MCILHIVFCTVCKYVLSICKLFCFFALSGARSLEFHSPRHLCCGDVTIKVIRFDLIKKFIKSLLLNCEGIFRSGDICLFVNLATVLNKNLGLFW